jgi:thymidine kinase
MEKKAGQLHLILGMMGSSKSLRLIEEYNRRLVGKQKVLFIKHKWDDNARGYHTRFAKIDLEYKAVEKISEIKDRYIYDCIFVDEIQFFQSKDFVVDINNLIAEGIDVYLAGLPANANQEIMTTVAKILPYCDFVVKLQSICDLCGSQIASLGYKKINPKDVSISKENVGGIEGEKPVYGILCKTCFNKINTKFSKRSK